MARCIVEDEKRRNCPQTPSSRRVGVGRANLLVVFSPRCTPGIAFVVASQSWLGRARYKLYRTSEMEHLAKARKKAGEGSEQ